MVALTVQFNTRVRETFKPIINKALEKLVENIPELNTKGEALEYLYNEWIKTYQEEIKTSPEIINYKDSEIKALCEIGFLKRIKDKTGEKLFYCLKHQRPDGKGKPILMSDGNDYPSIKELCEACKTGFFLNQQNKMTQDQISAIRKFGSSEIIVTLYYCNHPKMDFIQAKLGSVGSFYCAITNKREIIDRKCDNENCGYLNKEETSIQVKDTKPYQELKKQLEHKED